MLPALEMAMQMSCIIPATIGLCLFNKIPAKYYPLCLMMIVDVVAEIYNHGTQTKVLFNLYGFVNFVLFITFVYSNDFLSKRIFQLLILVAIICSGSIFLKHGILAKPIYTVISLFYSIILFIAINILSKQIFAIKERLVNNFWFWFSVSCVLYYGYAMLLFGLSILDLKNTPYYQSMNNIWTFVNLAYYVLISVAIFKTTKPNLPSLMIHKFKYD